MNEASCVAPTDLKARQLEVVILIGRDGLRYKAAAAQMLNQIAWGPATREGVPSISWRTVQQYATEVRDLIGSERDPKRALWEYYRDHADELDALWEEAAA